MGVVISGVSRGIGHFTGLCFVVQRDTVGGLLRVEWSTSPAGSGGSGARGVAGDVTSQDGGAPDVRVASSSFTTHDSQLLYLAQ